MTEWKPKRKPKLTKALENEFRVVEAFGSIQTKLEVTHTPKRTINSLCKMTRMHKNTFNETLKRTKEKGYVTYQTHGRGRKATDIKITETGAAFIRDTLRKYAHTRQVSSSELFMDLDDQKRLPLIPAAVIDLDILLQGRISMWRCPIHPKSLISYKPLKGRGAVTKCRETGCIQEKRWYVDIGELPASNLDE